jgi:hypothetical protein
MNSRLWAVHDILLTIFIYRGMDIRVYKKIFVVFNWKVRGKVLTGPNLRIICRLNYLVQAGNTRNIPPAWFGLHGAWGRDTMLTAGDTILVRGGGLPVLGESGTILVRVGYQIRWSGIHNGGRWTILYWLQGDTIVAGGGGVPYWEERGNRIGRRMDTLLVGWGGDYHPGWRGDGIPYWSEGENPYWRQGGFIRLDGPGWWSTILAGRLINVGPGYPRY